MVDRIEMAKQYLQELLEVQDDIVGSFVAGSVARGESTESSDIDLVILVSKEQDVDGEKPPWWSNRSLATWREGVFIEAGPQPIGNYSEFSEVMHNGLSATHMRDALILYDTTGSLTKMQKRVRAEFMEPHWIRVRVEPHLQNARKGLSSFRDAVATGSPRLICKSMAGLTPHLLHASLLRCGISTSTARLMTQMADVDSDLAELMADLQGSRSMKPENAVALADFTKRELDFVDPDRSSEMFVYFDKKILSMAEKGQVRDVADLAWRGFTFIPSAEKSTPEIMGKADSLAQEWLNAVGWDKNETTEKVGLAESILEMVEKMMANLPPVENAAS